jgi:DNA modification methylase
MGALAGALSEVGWVQRIIVNKRTGHIVDGHARVELAAKQGEKAVPVVYVDLSEDEERTVLAALDPLAAMAGEDSAKREELLASLTVSDEALREMLLGAGTADALTDPDAVPDVPKKPKAKRGDLYLLGDHRLLCGDATDKGDVTRLGAVEAGLCVTDPPYGVSYDPAWRNAEAAKGNLAYAARRVGPVANDDRADWSEVWALFPGDVIYSWHPPGAPSLVHAAALQGSGFVIRMQIIWAKSNFPIGRGDYHVRHEPCWYAVRKGRPARRTNDRTQTTLWEVNLDKNVEGGHSTQKPVELMERPMRNHDFAEVYDPFVGSGTTIIAAERQGRRCYAMEISEQYVDVCVRRWEEYTGGKAVLDG